MSRIPGWPQDAQDAEEAAAARRNGGRAGGLAAASDPAEDTTPPSAGGSGVVGPEGLSQTLRPYHDPLPAWLATGLFWVLTLAALAGVYGYWRWVWVPG